MTANFVTDPDNCAVNPCKNGANCTDGVNDFTCQCVEGYEGKTCETSKGKIINFLLIYLVKL